MRREAEQRRGKSESWKVSVMRGLSLAESQEDDGTEGGKVGDKDGAANPDGGRWKEKVK